jgi:hypothetical protein
MTLKNVTTNSFVWILLTVALFVSCEKDFENIGKDIITNEQFDADKQIFEVLAYNQNLIKSRTDNISVNGIGVLQEDQFGKLEGDVVSQLGLPVGGVDFGENPVLDDVVFELPYNSKRIEDTEDGKPQFELENIYGNPDEEFQLKMYELGTFLNKYDETDPTKIKKYYSDKVYTKLTELFSDNFKPNANDTVYYVRRPDFDTLDDQGNTVEYYDTIKRNDLSPSIKLSLNKTFFETNFVNNTDEDVFSTFDKFSLFFKGIYLESTGTDGAYMPLNFSSGNITLYYTNDVLTDESTEDLNGDGDTDDTQVPVRTKQKMIFPISGIIADVYKRDYTTAISDIQSLLNNPNIIQGEEKLYIHGNAGSMTIMDVFANMDLADIRNNNWLITEANIVLNVNQDLSDDDVPSRLFLCKLDETPQNGVYKNTQILDVLTEGEAILDGYLQTEKITSGDDTTTKPVKYRFRITDYMSEVLKKEDPKSPSRFAIKVFHQSDLPVNTIPNDTIVRDYSWDQKGVIIYGNRYQSTDADYDKRVKLEIFYSKLND